MKHSGINHEALLAGLRELARVANETALSMQKMTDALRAKKAGRMKPPTGQPPADGKGGNHE